MDIQINNIEAERDVTLTTEEFKSYLNYDPELERMNREIQEESYISNDNLPEDGNEMEMIADYEYDSHLSSSAETYNCQEELRRLKQELGDLKGMIFEQKKLIGKLKYEYKLVYDQNTLVRDNNQQLRDVITSNKAKFDRLSKKYLNMLEEKVFLIKDKLEVKYQEKIQAKIEQEIQPYKMQKREIQSLKEQLEEFRAKNSSNHQENQSIKFDQIQEPSSPLTFEDFDNKLHNNFNLGVNNYNNYEDFENNYLNNQNNEGNTFNNFILQTQGYEEDFNIQNRFNEEEY